IGAHHHARPAARRRVVHRTVARRRERAHVDRVERPLLLCERLARQRQSERPRKHFRLHREDAGVPEAHAAPAGFASPDFSSFAASIAARPSEESTTRPPLTSIVGTIFSVNGTNTLAVPRLTSITSPPPKLWNASTRPTSPPSASSTGRSMR